MKTCLNCNEEVLATSRYYQRKKFCTKECKEKHYRKTHYNHTKYGVNNVVVGTIQELIVSVDLLKKGYEVFRSLGSSCSCDLAILKNGKLLRVEVTTGYIMGKATHHPPKEAQKYDILAVVIDGNIIYNPIEF